MRVHLRYSHGLNSEYPLNTPLYNPLYNSLLRISDYSASDFHPSIWSSGLCFIGSNKLLANAASRQACVATQSLRIDFEERRTTWRRKLNMHQEPFLHRGLKGFYWLGQKLRICGTRGCNTLSSSCREGMVVQVTTQTPKGI